MTPAEARGPKLSVVVPTRNSDRTIKACLDSIKSQSDIELIVVDNFSTDATPQIARATADIFISAGPERSAQRNIGARAAHAPVILFIDSDMELPNDLAAEVVRAFDDPSVDAVVIPESVEGDAYWLRCRNLEKHLSDGDPSIEAARGFRTASVLDVGGYDENLTGGEDWELSQRLLVKTQGATARTQARILHNEDGLTPLKSLRKKLHYGRGVSKMIGDHPDASNPGSRAGLLVRTVKQFPHQPTLAVGVLFLKTCEYSGVLVGAWPGFMRARAHKLWGHRRLVWR